MKVPPFSHLRFDLTLPKATEGRNHSFQKVYWDIGNPQGDTLSVEARVVMNLVVTIATETRMRAKDKQLLALQQFPGKRDVERANGH
ncbi:hypothetical protein Y699_04610 [Aspergillus fumigatus Z5]|nr:hypothetical protein Y699_04610 [Aspergillus fumigatus Z5]